MMATAYYVIHKRTGTAKFYEKVFSVEAFMWGKRLSEYFFIKKIEGIPAKVVDVSSCSGELSEFVQILEEA